MDVKQIMAVKWIKAPATLSSFEVLYLQLHIPTLYVRIPTYLVRIRKSVKPSEDASRPKRLQLADDKVVCDKFCPGFGIFLSYILNSKL